MAVTTEKKRSTLVRGSILDLPATGLDRKRFAYRWVNKTKLDLASDGYEPRGYQVTMVDGKTIGRGDLILCQKTREDADAHREYLEEMRKAKTETTLQHMKEQDDRLSFEIKRSGGKMKFEYGEE